MQDTDNATSRGPGKTVIVAGAVLATGLLGALGFAALHIPGALTNPGAAVHVAAPQPQYQQSLHDVPSEGSASDDEMNESSEEEIKEDSEPESDDHPDRRGDHHADQWLLPEAETRTLDEVYTITRGETLASISEAVGVSVDMLAEYNEIRDVHLIYEDSALVVPYSKVELPSDSDPQSASVED